MNAKERLNLRNLFAGKESWALREQTAYEKYRAWVFSLPLDEAKRLAERRLKEEVDLFGSDPNPAPDEVPENVPPGLKSLFRQYRSIGYASLVWLSPDYWEPSAYQPGYYKIGEDHEDYPVLLRAGTEEISVRDGDELNDVYPSVFHWLLILRDSYQNLLP